MPNALDDLVGLIHPQAPLDFGLGTLRLGDVKHGGSPFELPERIGLGGDQHHKLNLFPGGQRTVKAFGYHRRPVSFSGVLLGQTAFSRSKELEALCAKGEPVDWYYGAELGSVLVAAYHPEVANKHEIHYTLDLVIVADPTNPVSEAMAPPDTGILTGLKKAAVAMTRPRSPDPLFTALAKFLQWQVNMDATYPWITLIFDTARLLIDQAQAVEQAIIDYQVKAQKTAAMQADLDALIDSEEALTGIRMARITMAQFFGLNQPQTMWAAGITVFELASMIYGSAAAGLGIQASNNLSDPKITTPTFITTPPGSSFS